MSKPCAINCDELWDKQEWMNSVIDQIVENISINLCDKLSEKQMELVENVIRDTWRYS